MTTSRRHLLLTAAVGLPMAGLLPSLAGCNANPRPSGAGSSAAPGGAATGAPIKGGSFFVLSASKEIHWDPAKSQNLGTSAIHLLVRGLTTWKTSPTADTELVADLATDTGKTSDGGKTWTYTLKSGLKYADGTAITAHDVKFGLERSFDENLQGGLSYHKALLAGAADYAGPAKGKHLDSIEVTDDTTIVFYLDTAFADWPWITSMPAFAPIPVAKGMGIPAYDHTPPASGPYQVKSYDVGSQAVLIRNPHWGNDDVRLAGPDQITYQMGLNPDTVAQRLVDDSGDDKNAAGGAVTTAIIPKINADPAVKARTTVSSSGAADFLILNTSRPGLADVKVRQAIQYAINKQQIQTIAGGATYGGAIATTLIPPGIQGYVSYDLYPAPPTGDVAKAKQALGEAKVSGPLIFVVDSSDTGAGQIAASVAQDLGKLGMTVKVQAQDSDTVTKTTTESGDFDLAIGGWQADYPGAYAQLQPLFAKDQIGNGNYNQSRFSSPEVDAAIAAAVAETDAAKAAKAWGDLDQLIMKSAPVVPLYYGHQAYINGSNTTGTYIPSFPSYPNVLVQGLKS